MANRELKRGDPWSIRCTRNDSGGSPVSIVGETIISQLRAPGFVADWSVAVVDGVNGIFDLTMSPAETLLVPVGPVSWDVKYTALVPGSTKTQTLIITEDVSRAP